MDRVLLCDVALLRGRSVFGGAGPDSVERGVGIPSGALYPAVVGEEFLALRPVGVRCGLEVVRCSATCLLFVVEDRLSATLSRDSCLWGLRCSESGGEFLMSFLLCR